MRYEIVRGPVVSETGKTFVDAVNQMIDAGWQPKGGVSTLHLTGASAMAKFGDERFVFHGVDVLFQAVTNDSDSPEIPEDMWPWIYE